MIAQLHTKKHTGIEQGTLDATEYAPRAASRRACGPPLTVFALPKASMMGLLSMILFAISSSAVLEATRDRYFSISFVVSVLPLPESPQMMMLALPRPFASRRWESAFSAI